MKLRRSAPLAGAALVALTALLAACGGGGGGSSTLPGGGGGGGPTPSGSPSTSPTGTSSPTTSPTNSASPSPSPSPSPTSSAGITGTLSIGGKPVANSQVVFSCGCSQQAGLISTDQNGNFTIGLTEPAIPSSPSPTYTSAPDRNYMIIGFTGGTQAWTMEYLAHSPVNNISLGNSDVFAAMAALYIYDESGKLPANKDQSFDNWNFITIEQWTTHLRTGPLTLNETQFMHDVTSAQTGGTSLAPSVPGWFPTPRPAVNNAIAADIVNVQKDGRSVDTFLPTPCPGINLCTGPTPKP